jgi:hypothetical protein
VLRGATVDLNSCESSPSHLRNKLKCRRYLKAAVEALVLRAHGGVQGHAAYLWVTLVRDNAEETTDVLLLAVERR